jgi:hypothetical protein
MDPVRIVATEATPTAVVRALTTWDRFPALWPGLLDEVWAFVREAGLDPGRNVMLYADDRPAVEVGVEVRGPFTPHGRVVPSALPAGRAAHTVQRGALSAAGLQDAHAAVVGFCRANGYERSGVRFEVYGHVGDDPAAQETGIFWLLC